MCLRQVKDLQLAIAVTRVWEGDDGPVLSKLLQDEVLPVAAQEGNRWLASWAFWMLGRKDMAVRALIVGSLFLLTLTVANVTTDPRLHPAGDAMLSGSQVPPVSD